MLRLLEELGIDQHNFIWQDLAACRGYDTNLFYDFYERDSTVAVNVVQACYTCPVLKQCYEAGRDNNEWGVWGGVYRNQYGKIDHTKNNKTDEEWELLESRLGYDARE